MSSDEKKNNNVSHHILPTSANLLGLCFLLLSSINLFGTPEKTFVDEMLGIAILLFLGASIFSYASIRSRNRTSLYEKIADIIFLSALSFLTVVSILLILMVK